MHIRFDYPFYRIQEAYESLKLCAETEEGIFDQMILEHLDDLLKEDAYDCSNLQYKATVLKYLNHLVLL